MSPSKQASLALTALLAMGVSACQTGPGPIEQQANTYATMCQQGNRNACAQWNAMSGSVQAERGQQSQNNAIVSGLAGAAGGLVAGTVIGNATAGPRYYGRGYYHPYYRRGWW